MGGEGIRFTSVSPSRARLAFLRYQHILFLARSLLELYHLVREPEDDLRESDTQPNPDHDEKHKGNNPPDYIVNSHPQLR